MNSTMGVLVKGLKENDGLGGKKEKERVHDIGYVFLQVLLFYLDLIRVLSGAYEFQENVSVHPDEEAVLKRLDAAIREELENRFGEKYERLGDVSCACMGCHSN